jgi:uncharacterized membrane protein YccC
MQHTPNPKDTTPLPVPESQTTPAPPHPIISQAPASPPVSTLLSTQASTRTPLYDDPNHVAYGWQQMDQVLDYPGICALKRLIALVRIYLTTLQEIQVSRRESISSHRVSRRVGTDLKAYRLFTHAIGTDRGLFRVV